MVPPDRTNIARLSAAVSTRSPVRSRSPALVETRGFGVAGRHGDRARHHLKRGDLDVRHRHGLGVTSAGRWRRMRAEPRRREHRGRDRRSDRRRPQRPPPSASPDEAFPLAVRRGAGARLMMLVGHRTAAGQLQQLAQSTVVHEPVPSARSGDIV